MKKQIAILWFREDFRLNDNLALNIAASDYEILPIYILDKGSEAKYDFYRQIGEASRVWLYHSLDAINNSIKKLGGTVSFYKGNVLDILKSLISRHDVKACFYNKQYLPYEMQRDAKIKKELRLIGVECKSFNSSLLFEPSEILKKDNTPFKVFTPFYKFCKTMAQSPRKPVQKPKKIHFVNFNEGELDELDLLPKSISWHKETTKGWDITEEGALKKLDLFLQSGIKNYKINRDFPALDGISKLSPYLHFGQISPNQILHYVSHGTNFLIEDNEKNIDVFLSEIGWREFGYNLLYNNHTMPKKNLQSKFDKFNWNKGSVDFEKWKKGVTGYPIIDAGMRELWQTGFMHNRVRMIVASFLTKNLLIDWKRGEEWFWDCLFDADLASNTSNWQWVAGSGADAQPYFRIFNPILQGEKFDVNGEYIKKYVPELSNLSIKYIHKPWEAPTEILQQAKVTLGKDYPMPIVDLKFSRNRALTEFKKL